jgi:hypothetical protein
MESFSLEATRKALQRAREAAAVEEQELLARYPNSEVLRALAKNPRLHPNLHEAILDNPHGKDPYVALALLDREDLRREALIKMLQVEEPFVRKVVLKRALADPSLPPEALIGPFSALLREGGRKGLEAIGRHQEYIRNLLLERKLNKAFWIGIEGPLIEEANFLATSEDEKLKEKAGEALLDLLERGDVPKSVLDLVLEVGMDHVPQFADRVLERDLFRRAYRLVAQRSEVWGYDDRLTKLLAHKNFDKETLRLLLDDCNPNPRVVAGAPKLDKEGTEMLLDFMRRDARFFLLQMKTGRNVDDVYLGRSDLHLNALRVLAERGLLSSNDLSSMLYEDEPLLPQALLLGAERGDVPRENLLRGYMALRAWIADFARESRALETIAQRFSEKILSQGVDERKLKALEVFAEI